MYYILLFQGLQEQPAVAGITQELIGSKSFISGREKGKEKEKISVTLVKINKKSVLFSVK